MIYAFLIKTTRYAPVLRVGFLLWMLGTGLHLLFTQHSHIAVYIAVLAAGGSGVGFVHQPGKYDLFSVSCIPSQLTMQLKVL